MNRGSKIAGINHHSNRIAKMCGPECIVAIAAGDEQAFGNLMVEYERKMIRWFYNHDVSWDVARELTQDLFLKIWKKAGTFKSQFDVHGWLYAIARNIAKDHHRALNREKRHACVLQCDDFSAIADSYSDESRRIDAKDVVDALLAGEDESVRDFLYDMVDGSGSRLEEMAEEQHLSCGGVRYRYGVLLKSLRQTAESSAMV